jgi:hypothetical protein
MPVGVTAVTFNACSAGTNLSPSTLRLSVAGVSVTGQPSAANTPRDAPPTTTCVSYMATAHTPEKRRCSVAGAARRRLDGDGTAGRICMFWIHRLESAKTFALLRSVSSLLAAQASCSPRPYGTWSRRPARRKTPAGCRGGAPITLSPMKYPLSVSWSGKP